MEVKVLGTGCCRSTMSAVDNTASLVEEVAHERGVAIELSKVQDIRAMVACGAMTSPAVVIDGTLVHSGSVPARERVVEWLGASAAA